MINLLLKDIVGVVFWMIAIPAGIFYFGFIWIPISLLLVMLFQSNRKKPKKNQLQEDLDKVLKDGRMLLRRR